MFELNGKYATAKVFTDVVDNESISQVINLLNQPYTEGSKIRMMPDIHAGAGCTIGTTMTIADKICPNLVGVDVSCGMHTVQLAEKEIDCEALDKIIRERIPSGFGVRNKLHKNASHINLEDLCCTNKIKYQKVYKEIGTLGGGNHFVEAGKDNEGNIYIVVHSGSRHLGRVIAEFYQETASNNVAVQNIPKPLAYVENELFEQYLHDMEIAQRFAFWNRKTMIDEIISGLGLTVVDEFVTVHNYIDIQNRILRKGAVSAQKGEKLLIPINMRDGSLVCTGKGNPDWNYSAPHGAGRLMSRSQAKEAFTVEEYQKQMNGIYTTSVNQSTLDECPMAYKNIDDIINNIGDTVEINAIIKPIYNFKASDA